MNIREAALDCVIKITEYKKDYEESIFLYTEKLEYPSELIKIVSGVLKNLLLLDYIIEKTTKKPKIKLSKISKNIIRLAVYEILFIKTPEYAVINSYVDIAKIKENKAKGFINWALREYSRNKHKIRLNNLDAKNRLSTAYSQPKWLIDKWIKAYGVANTCKLSAYFNKPPKLVIRTNKIKISTDNLKQLLNENKIDFISSKVPDCLIIKHQGNIKNIPGFYEGYWIVQGESSSLASIILNPQENQSILDVCAAPGGKTTHIASLTNNTALITAIDVNKKRISKIKENCERLSIKNVEIIDADATTIKLNTEYDKIIIDAPCSNTGVMNKRPDARWKKSPQDIENLSKLQLNILENLSGYVKINGEIVYSTCSIENEENQEVINRFLEQNLGFKLSNIKDFIEFKQKPEDLYLCIKPFLHGMEGFFIAKLIRIE